jgi:hypothetical protein
MPHLGWNLAQRLFRRLRLFLGQVLDHKVARDLTHQIAVSGTLVISFFNAGTSRE